MNIVSIVEPDANNKFLESISFVSALLCPLKKFLCYKNKTQFIDMSLYSSTVKSSQQFHSYWKITNTEVCSGLQIVIPDLRTMHEEADVIIPNQVVSLANLGFCRIKVISENMDVFLLLVHYYADKTFTATLIMEPTSQGRLSVNIGSTVAKHRCIAPHLLSAHALTGCDTVV